MEILLPELVDSLLSHLDALSFRSFGSVSTQFYNAVCAFPLKPKKIKRHKLGLIYEEVPTFTSLQYDALFSGHLRLVSDVVDIDTASFDFLTFYRLFDAIEMCHAKGTLAARLPKERELFKLVATSQPTPRFLYWLFTTLTNEANWFFTSSFLMSPGLNEIISTTFLHPDRHDALTTLFIQRIPDLYEYVVLGRGTYYFVRPPASILFMDALYSGRMDTMQWVHQHRRDAILNFAKIELNDDELGYANDADVLAFVMANAPRRTFTTLDVVLAILSIKDGGRVWEIFNAHMENLSVYYLVPQPTHINQLSARKITVTSFRAAMEALSRLHNKLKRPNSDGTLKSFATNVLRSLIGKCNNFTLFRYILLQQPLNRELLANWPTCFFFYDRVLHRQDLKYFKLLLEHFPQEWETFVHDYRTAATVKYSTSTRKTVTDVYQFITLAGAKDHELYRAYCREIKRPCNCCNGKCAQ